MIKKLREILDTVEPHVEKGGKYEKLSHFLKQSTRFYSHQRT